MGLKLWVDKKDGKRTNPICASPLVQDVHYRLETFFMETPKSSRYGFYKIEFCVLKSVNLMQDLGKSRIGSRELFHLLVSDAPADVSQVSVVSQLDHRHLFISITELNSFLLRNINRLSLRPKNQSNPVITISSDYY